MTRVFTLCCTHCPTFQPTLDILLTGARSLPGAGRGTWHQNPTAPRASAHSTKTSGAAPAVRTKSKWAEGKVLRAAPQSRAVLPSLACSHDALETFPWQVCANCTTPVRQRTLPLPHDIQRCFPVAPALLAASCRKRATPHCSLLPLFK